MTELPCLRDTHWCRFWVALGLALDNLALGVAVGAGIGMAFGAAPDRRRWDAEPDGPGKQRTRLLVDLAVGVLPLLVGVAALAFRMVQ